jgi:hypothetical protein
VAKSLVSSAVRARDQDSADQHTYKVGRKNCWGVVSSTNGDIAYAPFEVARDSATGKRTVVFDAKGLTAVAVEMRDMKASEGEYADPTGAYYKVTIGKAKTAADSDKYGQGVVLSRFLTSEVEMTPSTDNTGTKQLVHRRGKERFTLELDSSSASKTLSPSATTPSSSRRTTASSAPRARLRSRSRT